MKYEAHAVPFVVQVMLVGHGVGGACISYAMEQYPEKIAKAIFLCATMVSNGQRPFDVFSEEVGCCCLHISHLIEICLLPAFSLYGAARSKMIILFASKIYTPIHSRVLFSYSNCTFFGSARFCDRMLCCSLALQNILCRSPGS